MRKEDVVYEMIIYDNVSHEAVYNPALKKIPVFNEVIKKCRGKGITYDKANELAAMKFTYIYFMTHYKSPYVIRNPLDKEERDTEVREVLQMTDWKPEKEVIDALEVAEVIMNNEYIRLLNAARFAALQNIKYLEDVNYELVDKKGNYLYKPKDVIAVIKETRQVIQSLVEAEKDVKNDIIAQKNIYGKGKVGTREDPR